MADPELEAIRQQRLAQLQSQSQYKVNTTQRPQTKFTHPSYERSLSYFRSYSNNDQTHPNTGYASLFTPSSPTIRPIILLDIHVTGYVDCFFWVTLLIDTMNVLIGNRVAMPTTSKRRRRNVNRWKRWSTRSWRRFWINRREPDVSKRNVNLYLWFICIIHRQ